MPKDPAFQPVAVRRSIEDGEERVRIVFMVEGDDRRFVAVTGLDPSLKEQQKAMAEAYKNKVLEEE